MTLLDQVKAYALDHYNDNFYYSAIVECYTDDELEAELSQLQVTTLDGFIRASSPIREVYLDRENDAKNSAF